ncbi:hypothetical protein ACVW0Y_002507 [Pseudomonas sp. TE3786]
MSKPSCWQVLKLERDSSERDIRRQYAALLKVTRPDDDPAAFQQLREAYEQAMAEAREQTADEEGDLSLVEAPVAASAQIEEQEQRVQELLAQLTTANLDDSLNSARQHNCQALFEHRLLQLCLSEHAEAEAITQWALVRFDWLLPWQSPILPRSFLQLLAERLLRWQFARLEHLLAARYEAAALDQVEQLLSAPWLDSLDRREWLQQRLLSWLTGNTDWSPGFFDGLCRRLELRADDYQMESNPLWRALLHRLQGQHLLHRLQQQLTQKKPVLFGDQAAWLLLKDLGSGRRRRLIDRMGDAAWNACAELTELLGQRHPELLAKLGLQRLPDWQQWRPQPVGSAWLWWLLLACFAAVQLAAPSMPTRGGLNMADQSRLGEYLGMATAGAAGLYCCNEIWRHLSRTLAMLDGWLSNLLLPAALSRQGAGLLVMRHVVPCLTFGALVGLWVNQWVAQAGALAGLAGVITAAAALLYCLYLHGLLPLARARKTGSKGGYIWNVLGVILLLSFLLYSTNGSHNSSRFSSQAPSSYSLGSSPKETPSAAANPFGLNDSPLVDPAQDPDLAPPALSKAPAQPLTQLKYSPPGTIDSRPP